MTKPKRQIPVAGTKPAPQVYFRIDRPEPRVVDDAPNWRDRVREIVTPIWFDYHGTHFFDGDGKMIAQIRGWGGLTSSGLSDEEARQVQEKNAAFIVNAVNEYDALVAENERWKSECGPLLDYLTGTNELCSRPIEYAQEVDAKLNALVAENEALRQKLNSIAFYVKDHGGHLPPCDLCLIEGIVSGDILPIETAHGGNDE